MAATIIENTRVDLSAIHPSLRHLYGDGMPVRTYRTEGGTTVRIFGSCLPETQAERERREAEAWRVARNIARGYALEKMKEGQTT